jgi:enterochelin esterase-like enzyme
MALLAMNIPKLQHKDSAAIAGQNRGGLSAWVAGSSAPGEFGVEDTLYR